MSSWGYKAHQIHSLYDIISYILVQVYWLVEDQSPPRRDLKVSDPAVRDVTLGELQLAPSSILLLRFDDEKLNREPVAYHEIFSNKKPLDSHVPAPLAPEVILQAVDLPLPPPPVVLEANIESISSTGTKSVESKLPKWLKLAQSESQIPRSTTCLMLLFQKNKLLGAFDLRKCTVLYLVLMTYCQYWGKWGSTCFDQDFRPPMTSFTIPAPLTCLRDSAAIWESFPSRHMIYVSSSEFGGKYFSGSRIKSLRGTSTVDCHYTGSK